MFSISRVEFNGATGFMIDDIRFLLALEYEQKVYTLEFGVLRMLVYNSPAQDERNGPVL